MQPSSHNLLEQFSPSGADPFAEARALVDKELADLSLQLLSLKSQQNALLPVSALPSVALLSVFFALSVEEPPETGELGWIKATHVCRAWRLLALKSPALWSRIAFGLGMQWAAEMIPLSNAFKLIPDLLRTTRLSLTVYSDTDPTVKSILGCPAPLLRGLRLTWGENTKMEPVVPSNEVLFGGCAPNLTAITLNYVFIPWRCFPDAPLLTHLDVRAVDFGLTESPHSTLNRLLDVLHGSPALDFLDLDQCLPRAVIPLLSAHRRVVHLPYLEYLSLAGPPADVAVVFGSLKIPASTRINLVLQKCSIFPRTEPTSILPSILTHYAQADAAQFQSFALSDSGSSMEIVGRWAPLPSLEHSYRDDVFKAHREPSDVDLRLEFSWTDDSEIKLVFPQLFHGLPLTDVQSLCVEAQGLTRFPLGWADMLGRCQKVKALNIQGNGAATILPHLAPIEGPGGTGETGSGQGNTAPSTALAFGSQQSTILFPNLQRILVVGVDFRKESRFAPLNIDTFLSALQWREKAVSQIQQLDLSGCLVSDISNLDVLSEIVPNVYRNGIPVRSYSQ
ncbi:hypothetical protein BC834DRAFT_909937 [Gloeopeniophorella convolvens]|nr:hypothetical protein BC834DRAFT_909937 [Gloeopeniophorella convolvens]